jgi:hypothetical protein
MGNGGIAPPFLTSELDGGERSASRPGRFTCGEKAHGNHCERDISVHEFYRFTNRTVVLQRGMVLHLHAGHLVGLIILVSCPSFS